MLMNGVRFCCACDGATGVRMVYAFARHSVDGGTVHVRMVNGLDDG